MTTSCEESWPSVISSQIKTEEKKNNRKKKVKEKKRKEKEKKENPWKTFSKNRLLFSNT